jgi:hypothetical protein
MALQAFFLGVPWTAVPSQRTAFTPPLLQDVKWSRESGLSWVGKKVLALNHLNPDQQGICSATLSAGGARGNTLAMGTVTVVMDGYRTRPEPFKVSSRAAKVARRLRSSTYAKLYSCETLLKRLVYDLKYMALEFGPVVIAPKPVTGQGRQFRGRAADCKLQVLEILRRPAEESLIYV